MCFNGDMDTTNTHINTLADACKQQAGKVDSAIYARKTHPSYGYRKVDIMADLHRLEGMLFAFKAAAAGDNSGLFSHQAYAAAADLGIDLHDLQDRAVAS